MGRFKRNASAAKTLNRLQSVGFRVQGREVWASGLGFRAYNPPRAIRSNAELRPSGAGVSGRFKTLWRIWVETVLKCLSDAKENPKNPKLSRPESKPRQPLNIRNPHVPTRSPPPRSLAGIPAWGCPTQPAAPRRPPCRRCL